MSDAAQLIARAEDAARAGDFETAFETLRDCAARTPECAPAWLGMARLLMMQDARAQAVQVLGAGMAAVTPGDDRRILAQGFAELVAPMTPNRYHPRLARDLGGALESGARPELLARVSARVLCLDDRGDDAAAIGSDALWTGFLSRCLNVSPAMETRLVALRAAWLARYAGAETVLPAAADGLAALALQAFAGGYAWLVGPGEAARIATLGDGEGDALVATLYAPVDALREAQRSAIESCDTPRGLVPLLIARSATAPAAERALAAAIPAFGEGAAGDAAAGRVADQYEAHPYPRWQDAPEPAPARVRDYVARLPGIDAGALPSAPFDVLIAGCGTGYEAIDMARMDDSLAITAIDLSRASLGYAARKAQTLGLANIGFAHGDLMRAGDGGARFDMVSATGVLHHLADPGAGLASLAAALRPGGVARIALYSRRARARVYAARARIAAAGYPADDAGIRAFRQEVLGLPEHDPLAVLVESDDFWSMSGTRDLLFHAQETAFAPSDLEGFAARAGLAFVALDVPPAALAAFRAMHGGGADPSDLALWDRVEERDPDSFAGMLHFWCQKPRG